MVSSSTQSPYTLRDVVAAALGLAVEDVREVVVPDVGGGFGEGADLSRGDPGGRRGAPARTAGQVGGEPPRKSRVHGPASRPDARVGFTRDGAIVAVDATFLADVGAYPLQGDGLTANTVSHLPGPYRVPHYRNAGTSVVTEGAQRPIAPQGRPEAVFVMERLMDIGARRLGLDPAEIRRETSCARPTCPIARD